MKPRTLLILVLVVAALGAYLWFVERDLPSSEERAKLGRKLLRGLEADAVEQVVLEWDDHKVRLERQPAAAAAAEGEGADGGEESAAEDEAAAGLEGAADREWRLVEPAELAPARADAAAVDRLLDTVLGLETRRTLEGVDRAATGLADPRARVTLVTSPSKSEQGGDEPGERVLEIGAEVPASRSLVVALAGEPDAQVVEGDVYAQATREPGDWRDRRMFTGRREDVQRLTLTRAATRAATGTAAAEPVVLARRGEGFWLEAPVVDRADADRVDRLLGDLASLSAQRFLDDPEADPAALGLEPPQATLEARFSGAGEPFRLELGAPVAEGSAARWARVGRQLFETSGPLAETLATPVSGWQSAALSSLRLYQIDRATVERSGGATLTLERDGSDWKRDGATIPYTPVSELLYALTDARADGLLRRDEARRRGVDLGSPALTVTLEPGTGEAAETLQVFAPSPAVDGRVPAMTGGRDFVLLLDPGTLDALGQDLEALEAAEPVAPVGGGDDVEAGEAAGAGEPAVEVEEPAPGSAEEP